MNRDYQRIENAISYLVENASHQPSLKDVASSADLSPHHFQRIFTEWAGVSPKTFLRYLTLQSSKKH